jgi:hypothetical protein
MSSGSDIWDDIIGFLTGSIPIPDDYEPQPGDRIATTIGIINKGVLKIDDSEMLGELDAISDIEYEDSIYRKTGIKASMVNRVGKIIDSGKEWEYKYTYDIVQTPGTPGIVVVAIAIVAVCTTVIAVLWAIDTYIASNMKIITPWGEVNLFPILAIGIIILIILIVFRELLGGRR